MIDYIEITKNDLPDAENLQSAINKAVSEGLYTLIVKGGEWSVDKTLLLPEYLQLILDGAKINYVGEGVAFTNSHSVTTYKNVIAAQQKGITITGENGAEIKGTIFFNNVTNCTVNGLCFADVENGVVLTSTVGVKLKDLTFINCVNGILLGVGASDIMAHGLDGQAVKNVIKIDDTAFNAYYRLYHPHEVRNLIVRGVSGNVETFVDCVGKAEKLIFTDFTGKAENLAFSIKNAKHVTINDVKVKGKLINADHPENQVFIK